MNTAEGVCSDAAAAARAASIGPATPTDGTAAATPPIEYFLSRRR